MSAKAQALLREVSEATSAWWRLEGRFASGKREGAWRVRHGATVAVFKWFEPSADTPYNPDAPVIVEVLRDAGYPTPAWLSSGVTSSGVAWSIQELVDGDPVRELDLRSAEMFLELIDLQRTLTLPTELSWNTHVRDLVFSEHPSHGVLRGHGGSVAQLLHAALDLAAPYALEPLPDTEMVHSDLSVANLLERDGQLIAVVDIAAAGRGCSAYDLLAPVLNGLHWDSDPRAIDRLVHYGLDTFGPGPIAIATACAMIETTRWYQRSDPDRIEQRARRILQWLTRTPTTRG